MYIKTTVRCYYPPTCKAKIEKTDNTKCWRGHRATESLILYWECKLVQPLWKATFHPDWESKFKHGAHTMTQEIHSQMSNQLKQLKCPSAVQRIDLFCDTQTVENTAMEMNELEPHVIMLRKRLHPE